VKFSQRLRPALLVGALASTVASCTAAPSGAYLRMTAAHNALATLGLAQVGPVSSGTVSEGQSFRSTQELEAGCYTFMAFGADGLRDVDLTIANAQGQTVAQDNAHDPQAGVRFCPSSRGRFQITARAAQGAGLVTLSSWRGGVAESRPAGAPGSALASGGPGTCGEPLALELGQTVNGDTSQGTSRLRASCADGDAPEFVYRLRVPRRMQITLASEQEFDGAIYILRNCSPGGSRRPGRPSPEGPQANEIACNDDDEQVRRSRIVQVLDPGEYYVVVDGFGDNSGPFTLAATGQDVPSADEVCQQAAALTPGRPVQGDTAREFDVFHGSCANHAPGPDRVFRFDLPQESRVQATLETPGYDGALFIRRACAAENSEIACNDDAESTRQARINTVLPAGPYFVYADAYNAGQGGPFTLQVDTAPVTGAGLAGDTCADAQPFAVSTTPSSVQGNLLVARDDAQPSCGGGADTPDLVYRVDVTTRGRLKLWFSYMDETLREGGGLALQVLRSCNTTAPNNEVACRALNSGADNALETVVTPGTYFVVVDAARARTFGRFTLDGALEDMAAMETACRRAPALVPGRTVTGTTAGTDVFHATCAGNARSPENLYRLTLRRRQHVRIEVTSTNPSYDPAIYLRSNCADPSTERACVDDTNGTTNAVIEDDLDAGTYTVFVDGFSSGNQGPYTLRAEVTAPGAGTGTGGGRTPPPPPRRTP
jgi:hypothetical protein